MIKRAFTPRFIYLKEVDFHLYLNREESILNSSIMIDVICSNNLKFLKTRINLNERTWRDIMALTRKMKKIIIDGGGISYE